jgi:hypothetical protein
MKSNTDQHLGRQLRGLVACWLCWLLPCGLSAHERVVHEAITQHAAALAASYSPGYTQFLATISPPQTGTGMVPIPLLSDGSAQPGPTPGAWMVFGSYHEDDNNTDAGGHRPYDL